jgi:glycosyltransferase involved in cell wall biosynthesis
MKFSVIIPLYNKAPYIEKALRSVLDQSFMDYEIIVVDDGSKDDSADIAEKVLSGAEVQHQLIRQENAGVSMARNNGVAFSHGDYLCFLDADDWWAPTFLEEMSQLIEEYPEAGIYGTGYTIVNETKHKTRVAPIGVDPGFEKETINYCQVYAKTLAMPLTSITVAIPRAVFDQMQGFPKGIKLGEDFLLWIRIALKYRVAYLNKPLAYYNQDSNPTWRGTGHLVDPECHMLWQLQDLEHEEKTNPDYKALIDNLRTYSLLPYYLSRQYRAAARKELAKVDWSQQPAKVRKLYKLPVSMLKGRYFALKFGSAIKQAIRKHL